jgi:hypothetical protein
VKPLISLWHIFIPFILLPQALKHCALGTKDLIASAHAIQFLDVSTWKIADLCSCENAFFATLIPICNHFCPILGRDISRRMHELQGPARRLAATVGQWRNKLRIPARDHRHARSFAYHLGIWECSSCNIRDSSHRRWPWDLTPCRAGKLANTSRTKRRRTGRSRRRICSTSWTICPPFSNQPLQGNLMCPSDVWLAVRTGKEHMQ